jgi:hypothetical protein
MCETYPQKPAVEILKHERINVQSSGISEIRPQYPLGLKSIGVIHRHIN